MTVEDIKKEYLNLGEHYITKDVDRLNKKLIKQKEDVSCLKDIVLSNQEYHRTYFQVSLGQIKKVEDKFKFIEDNFSLLDDWWHVDQLLQFINTSLTLDFAYKKAKEYTSSSLPFVRRWGYVIFLKNLDKEDYAFSKIVSLLKNDEEYYVIMAEAWLISSLAIYNPEKTFNYLSNCPLNYSIVGRAIQKICDSFRIHSSWKEKFKTIRKKYK